MVLKSILQLPTIISIKANNRYRWLISQYPKSQRTESKVRFSTKTVTKHTDERRLMILYFKMCSSKLQQVELGANRSHQGIIFLTRTSTRSPSENSGLKCGGLPNNCGFTPGSTLSVLV